ncbi:MAG TPA: hypothetical protein VE865_12000 [Bradyrhizobium sp.]|nr:hypothetical protein [Bradyrhizobium sp.]
MPIVMTANLNARLSAAGEFRIIPSLISVPRIAIPFEFVIPVKS